jgi:hypothetical protein
VIQNPQVISGATLTCHNMFCNIQAYNRVNTLQMASVSFKHSITVIQQCWKYSTKSTYLLQNSPKHTACCTFNPDQIPHINPMESDLNAQYTAVNTAFKSRDCNTKNNIEIKTMQLSIAIIINRHYEIRRLIFART